MAKTCNTCYFGDQCPSNYRACKYYSPIGEEAENDYIDDIVEVGREEFHREWGAYFDQLHTL